MPARQEIQAELEHGNLPSFLRHLRPVDVVARAADGRKHRGRFWIMPDYLAIGADDDFVRIPMSPITAQSVADKFDLLATDPQDGGRDLQPVTDPPPA